MVILGHVSHVRREGFANILNNGRRMAMFSQKKRSVSDVNGSYPQIILYLINGRKTGLIPFVRIARE
jgi:hypothetical protein